MKLTKEQELEALIQRGVDEEDRNFLRDECELTHTQPSCLIYFNNGETIIVSSYSTLFMTTAKYC